MTSLRDRLAALSPEQREQLRRRLAQGEGTVRRSADERYPLSENQLGVWLVHRLAPESSAYNAALAVRIRQRVDEATFERSIEQLTLRHGILRTVYEPTPDGPRQRILDSLPMPATMVDAAGWTDETLAVRMRESYVQPFDLERGPVARIHLFSRGPTEHVLLLVVHHIAADFTSLGILVDEWQRLYRAEKMPPPALDYADYVARQRRMLAGPRGDVLTRYWSEQLAGGGTPLELPLDRPRPAQWRYRGATLEMNLGPELSTALKSLARAEGKTPFSVLLAAFQVLLHRYTGQTDITVGVPMSGRTDPDVGHLVGYLVNLVPIRANLEENPSFREFLNRLYPTVLGAVEHQDLPFRTLVERLDSKTDASRPQFVEVGFSFDQFAHLPAAEPLPFLQQQEGQFAWHAQFVDDGRSLLGVFRYAADLFDASTMQQLVEHFRRLLEGIVRNPEQRVGHLPLLSEEELHRILVTWNDTQVDFPPCENLHGWIARQVERTPNAAAVTYEDESLSYRELDRRANRLAHALRAQGVGPGARVAVCLERSLDLVVALLAVLKAGAAYVPLDPDYPMDRLTFMLEDSEPAVLLTRSELRPLARTGTAVLELPPGVVFDDFPDTPPGVSVGPSDLAYIIYTSGSTGQPKGAMNRHGAICNRLLWMQRAYALNAEDRVLQKTPFSFDVSVWEFFWPLMTGATLVVARPGGHKDPAYLVQTIAAKGITTIHFVPSMLQVFMEQPDLDSCRALRRIVCSGEALSWDLAQRCMAALPAELHNLYGPTEAAVDVSSWACRVGSERGCLPIGYPIANTRLYVLDAHLQPVPIGVRGELYIAGIQVGPGYWNRPELTAERFVRDPWAADADARMYRTGDLARYLPNGAIEYLGRIDHQVKLRGFRIELGEIEHRLREFPAVHEASVLLHEAAGRAQLVAYLVSDGEWEPSRIREHLRRTLPDHMVPSVLVRLEALPLTPNGKLDVRALQARPLPREAGTNPPGGTEASNAIEERVLEIWRATLNGTVDGVETRFLDAGGDSLLAANHMAIFQREFGVQLAYEVFFANPSARELAERVRTARRTDFEALVPAEPKPYYPASAIQKRLFVEYHKRRDDVTYNMRGLFTLRGALDTERLESAFRTCIRRHEAFRTSFHLKAEEVVQEIHPDVLFGIAIEDCAEDRIAARTDAWFRPFDLGKPPLVRAALFRIDPQWHVLGFEMHHIISDGQSVRTFFDEVARLYRGEGLPNVPLQYKDYACWQQGFARTVACREQEAFWQSVLAHAPRTLPLPTDGQGANAAQETANMDVDGALLEAVGALARKNRASPFMVFLAAFQALLARWTHQEDVVVGVPMAGRTHPSLQNVLGMFVNVLPMRHRASPKKSFSSFLAEVKQSALAAYEHQDFDLEDPGMRSSLQIPRGPHFRVVFAVHDSPELGLELEGLHIDAVRPARGMAKYDLTFQIFLDGPHAKVLVEYRSGLFSKRTIEDLLHLYSTVLADVTERPDIGLGELGGITPADPVLLDMNFDF